MPVSTDLDSQMCRDILRDNRPRRLVRPMAAPLGLARFVCSVRAANDEHRPAAAATQLCKASRDRSGLGLEFGGRIRWTNRCRAPDAAGSVAHTGPRSPGTEEADAALQPQPMAPGGRRSGAPRKRAVLHRLAEQAGRGRRAPPASWGDPGRIRCFGGRYDFNPHRVSRSPRRRRCRATLHVLPTGPESPHANG